jgi:4-carboxymuconolactone decarboxylase
VDQLSPASGPELPLDDAAEKQRATCVGEQFGQITPSLVQYTTDALFRDLWLRPGLAPRDRSLVTVSALVAMRSATSSIENDGREREYGCMAI